MGLAQDAPPNPQQSEGTIGGRPSRHHDAPSRRVSCQQQHPHQGQQPNEQAAHHAPKAATHRGAPAGQQTRPAPRQPPPCSSTPSATGGSGITPSRRERVEPTPQARGNQQALLDEQHDPLSQGQVSEKGPQPLRRQSRCQRRSQRRSSSSIANRRGRVHSGQTRATNQRRPRVWRYSQNQQVSFQERLFMAEAPKNTASTTRGPGPSRGPSARGVCTPRSP